MSSAARSILDIARTGAQRVGDELYSAGICARAGLLQADPPRQMLEIGRAVRDYGPLGSSVAIAAIRAPHRTAVVDELGEVTFSQLDRRANALANSWRARGLKAGDGVAVLARNHRGLLDATFACGKTGARMILLNTDFAGPQIREVAEREGTAMLVHDDEYSAFVGETETRLGRWRAWTDEPANDTLEALIAEGDDSPPPKPDQTSTVVILTSGTTGTPKGANRESPRSLTPLGALLGRVPFRGGETTVICAPLFHALGFAHSALAVGLGSTQVLRRRFDPPAALQDIAAHRPSAVIVVPIMLRRMLDAADAADPKPDTSSLRIIFCGGSQLGGALATRAMDTLGDTVYNLYGSTEVAQASIATPADLRVAPDTVGKPTHSTVVKLLDDNGREVPTGQTGRIFVGNAIPFEGYTGGGHKEIIDGLMSTGDVGHFDPEGRLFVDGRDDDMIVSGGENVFPAEVEELLAGHDAIDEAAVIGVPDEKFGHRLRAFVVPRSDARITEDEVKGHVRDNLARYKTPRDVVFIDELPRNPTGKVLKRKLAEHDA